MGTLQQIQQWSASHHPRWLVLPRVALGLCLFIKGISFISNTTALEQLISGGPDPKGMDWLPLFISWAHLLGGFLIIIGLFTRWAVFLQIPILIGAVVFITIRRGSFAVPSELGLSLIILVLLIFFLIEGGGPLSLDNYFHRNSR